MAVSYKLRYRQIIDAAQIISDQGSVKFSIQLKRIEANGLKVEVERFSKNGKDVFVGEGVRTVAGEEFVSSIVASRMAPLNLIKKTFPNSSDSLNGVSWDGGPIDLDGFAVDAFYLRAYVDYGAASDEAHGPRFMLEFRHASSVLSTTVLDVDRCRLAMTDGKSLVHEALNDPAGFGITDQVANEIKKSVEIHWPKMFSLVEAAMISASVQTPSASATPAPAKKNGRRI